MNHEEVLRYFDQRLDAYGPTVRALDWGSEDSQRTRFRILVEVGALEGCRVLDVGCGLGDLWEYLTRTIPTVDYEGCDVNPRMVAAARTRYPHGRFLVADPMSGPAELSAPYDYILASGLFYLRDEEFLRGMVAEMFSLCSRGVAFNSLSAWADHPEPGEYYAEPGRVLAFCRSLARRVVLRHDYFPHDFTVYVYRDS